MNTLQVQIACGDNVTMAVSREGELFAWGSAETHQLATGDEQDVAVPRRIPFPEVKGKDGKSANAFFFLTRF